MKVCRKLLGFENHSRHLDLITDAARIRVHLPTDDIVRMRCAFGDDFPEDASYALVLTAWPDRLDGQVPERRTIEPVPVVVEERPEHLALATKSLRIRVRKEPFMIEIADADGRVLHADLPGKPWMRDNLGRLYHYSRMGDRDYYYGFGEKSGYLNKKHRRMRMHNVDTIGYDAELTDPLYKHIPFYIRWDGENRTASGLFYHNAHDAVFDMGCERSGYWDKYTCYCADGGELDVFFINGPDIRDVVRRYTDLTGKTFLQPKFSLGYMASTMYYTELDRDSDRAILDFLDKCREEGIPCDGFFLSSGYTTGKDGKRCVFNWNRDRFPDPGAFIRQAAERGVAIVPNIKPGMLTTHPLHAEFDRAGAYVRDADGRSLTDRYWGGMASFVDFTNPEGRRLWKAHMKEALLDLGILSVWNDNNEYEIHDEDAVCHGDGSPEKIGGLRPIQPNLMARTAHEAVAEARPGMRPYVVNRAGFAGIQRYAQTWAGDNSTSWKSLKFNIPVILGMGLSGVANQGCDIGGFHGPAPEPELFVRWVQNGIFQPRFSIHSCNTDNTVTEPWMYPSYTRYIRDAIRLRYRLTPYLYSLLYEASTEGSPIMRPLVYEFQRDERVWEESFDFLLGPFLLVANVLEKGAKTRKVYLPEGAEWVDWETKERYAGGQTVELPVTLASIPMFLRGGAIIPMAPNLTNIRRDAVEELHVLVEPSAESRFVLYDDDGVTNNHLRGEYLKTAIEVRRDRDVIIGFTHEGGWNPGWKKMRLDVLFRDVAPIEIRLGDGKLPRFLDPARWERAGIGWYCDMEARIARIKYPWRREDAEVRVRFDVKDLISVF
jgi:alpha-glucosidase